jgi:hypothetical protein
LLRFELLSARHWPRNPWRIAPAVKVSSTYQIDVVVVVVLVVVAPEVVVLPTWRWCDCIN